MYPATQKPSKAIGMAAKGRFDDHGADIAKVQKVWCDFEVSFFEIEDRVSRAKGLKDFSNKA